MAGVLALAGCETVPSTASYYRARPGADYPPKPKNAVIPILHGSPKRSHKVIGSLRIKTSKDWEFAKESMLFNARGNGADAVIVRGVSNWTDTATFEFPATTKEEWRTGDDPSQKSQKKDKKDDKGNSTGHWETVHVPASTEVSTTHWLEFYSEMIVYK